MGKNYITCDGCGVVLDKDSRALLNNTVLNHEQEKVAEQIQCPVCRYWNDVGELEDTNETETP